MKNKRLFLVFTGIALVGIFQVQAENKALGFTAAVCANAIGTAVTLKMVDTVIERSTNAADVCLVGAISGIAHVLLPHGSFLVYKKVSGDNNEDETLSWKRIFLGMSIFFSCLFMNDMVGGMPNYGKNCSITAITKNDITRFNALASAVGFVLNLFSS